MLNVSATRHGRTYRAALLTGGLMLLATTAACNKKPTDQVVAVVNGDEISMQELNAELGNAQLPPGVDKKVVQQQLLQRLIDRRVLAQSAKEQGIDRDPAFIVEQRRVNEALLVDKLAKRTADSIPVPSNSEIDKFIAENPSLFANRKIYAIDQIMFQMPADVSRIKQLEPAKTMDEVAATLKTMNIPFQRGVQRVDSANVPPEQMARILALPKTEPFIIPQGNRVTVNLITGDQSAPLPIEQARPLATRAIRAQKLGKQGEDRLKEARTKAKIEYQDGFAPAAKPAGPAKPAT